VDVTLAALCDYSNITQEGKLNILGVFGEINPPMLPFALPQMFLVVSFSASPAEPRQKELRYVLAGADGHPIFDANQNVTLPSPARAGQRINLNSIIGLQGVHFEQPGDYAFSIQVGGEEKASVPLHVNPPRPSA
jgi:hypothetical protein